MEKLISYPDQEQAACSLPGAGNILLARLPGQATFNVAAIRARAGQVNILVGVALVSHLVDPESPAALYVAAYLLFDMLLAAGTGLRPFCPTGLIASLLVSKMKVVETPHLPKRFAWSMGASLALTIVALFLAEAAGIWIWLVLAVFFVLSWLDAVLGFCLGCWIYSRLFDCERCRLD